MVNIKIQDSLFGHVEYSTLFNRPLNMKWDRTPYSIDDTVIFTDKNLKSVNPNIKTKIAWLLESPEITKDSYNWMKSNYNNFEYVFTFDRELLEMSDKFIMCPIGGCWIEPGKQKIYDKNKNISIIASGKKNTIGQKMRHDMISQINSIDVYGRGYKVVENKLEALQDYRYSIVIENVKKDYYFTEKLIDSFMTGTIPIYYGCPSISDFFDVRGMIIVNSVDDLRKKMYELTEENYNSMKEHIKINFEKAKSFLIAEDIIYKELKNKKLL